MSRHAFFEPDARSRTAAAVRELEKLTSAEVVVALRKSSGSYRAADFLFGGLLALATLAAIVFVPAAIDPVTAPLDALLSFLIGASLCRRMPGLRRRLTRGPVRRTNVATAARAAFVELGVSRTRGRWGVLVYLSMLEREVEVVADIGIDPSALGEEWQRAVEALRAAARRADLEGFLAALGELGPLLGRLHPYSADDVNELPDEVSAR